MARLRNWEGRHPETEFALLVWFKHLLDCVEGQRSYRQAGPAMTGHGWSGDPKDLSETLRGLPAALGLPGATVLATGGGGGSPIRRTDDGDALYIAAERLLRELDRAKMPGRARRLAVGVTDFGLHYLVPRVMRRFLHAHPGTHVEFVEGEHWELREKVRDGVVAFAVGPETTGAPDFHTEPLFEMPRALLVHRRHKKLRRWQARWPEQANGVLRELAGEVVCLLAEAHNPRFRHLDFIPSPQGEGARITLPSYPHIRVWVRNNMAVGLGHKGYESENGPDRIVELELPERFGKTPMYLYFCGDAEPDLPSEIAGDLAAAFRTEFPRAGKAKGSVKKSRG